MTVKSGLYSGLLSGIKTSVLTKWGGLAAGIDPTIEGILTAADPMQELIDAMGFATKPDYMWGGDEASGATEIGGSGYDLTASGIDQEQTSAVLGGGNFSVFDANTDYMANTTDAALQVGSGSFAVVWVGNITSATGNYLFSDFNGTNGWGVLTGGTSGIRFYIGSASGTNLILQSGTIPVGAGEVLIAKKDATALDTYLYSSIGTGSNLSIHNESIDNPSQKVSVGDGATGNACRQEFGIAAIWKGAAAEGLTATHRSTLMTFLGY